MKNEKPTSEFGQTKGQESLLSALNNIQISKNIWFVTGAAGFIGSHLVESLLMQNQKVVGVDNFSTGSKENLLEVRRLCPGGWKNFEFFEGDIRDVEFLKSVLPDASHVLHQAALGSVPRSISTPLDTNSVNVSGFLNVLDVSRQKNVLSFVYAASSSTYGDSAELPKIESRIGRPLSPYAVTKLVNEQYAAVYSKVYGFPTVGLRYFNVFGPRQSPTGPYAAVIPRWVDAMLAENEFFINGDGTTSRDFCYVSNVVRANLLASVNSWDGQAEVFNIAAGERTTLDSLAQKISNLLARHFGITSCRRKYRGFREGDVKHSLASIEKAERDLGYVASHNIDQGLEELILWHKHRLRG